MNATMDERDQMLRTIAQHIVDGGYTYRSREELSKVISNKTGHDVTVEKEIKKVETFIKEIRAGV